MTANEWPGVPPLTNIAVRPCGLPGGVKPSGIAGPLLRKMAPLGPIEGWKGGGLHWTLASAAAKGRKNGNIWKSRANMVAASTCYTAPIIYPTKDTLSRKQCDMRHISMDERKPRRARAAQRAGNLGALCAYQVARAANAPPTTTDCTGVCVPAQRSCSLYGCHST